MHRLFAVGQNLEFNVLYPRQIFFQKEINIVKRAGDLPLGAQRQRHHFFIVHLSVNHANAHSAAAALGLDNERRLYLFRPLDQIFFAFDGIIRRRHRGRANLSGNLFGLNLVFKRAQCPPIRPDELNPAFFAHQGKPPIFGQKTVTRMNRVGFRPLGESNDFFFVQITGRPVFFQIIKLVGKGRFQKVFFHSRARAQRHGFDAHFAASADDPQSDLSPIGNQQFFNFHHRKFKIKTTM